MICAVLICHCLRYTKKLNTIAQKHHHQALLGAYIQLYISFKEGRKGIWGGNRKNMQYRKAGRKEIKDTGRKKS